MTDLGEKLKLLKCPDDMKDNALKFAATLSIVDTEELKGILDFLTSKGILKEEEGKILLTPSAFKILPRGLDFIKEQVGKMEKVGHLACYIERPARINAIDADKRILYMTQVGDSLVNPKGKYSKLPFHPQLFKTKYGDIDLENVQSMINGAGEISDKSIDFGVTKEDIKAPVEEEPVKDPLVDAAAAINNEPVTLDADAAIEADEIANDGADLTDGDITFKDESISLSDAIVSSEETVPVVQNEFEPVVSGPEPVPSEPVEDQNDFVPSADGPAPIPGEPPVDNNDRLPVIVNCLSQLYAELFGMPSVPPEMVESAKQYLAASGLDNSKLIYELLTSGSNYTDDQKSLIQAKINEHLGISMGGR